jgi:hypothetical protein
MKTYKVEESLRILLYQGKDYRVICTKPDKGESILTTFDTLIGKYSYVFKYMFALQRRQKRFYLSQHKWVFVSETNSFESLKKWIKDYKLQAVDGTYDVLKELAEEKI